MKIGIFGDSFAKKIHPALSILSTVPENKYRKYLKEQILKDTYIWHDYLVEQGHEVYDHGKGGSDIYYSYYQWLYNHEKYDLCIFLTTGFRRLSLRNVKAKNKPEDECWFTCLHAADALEKSKNLKYTEKKFAKGAYNYYTSIYAIDPFRHLHFNELMLREIQHKRPDTLFVPAIYNYQTPSPTLSDIYDMETIAMEPAYIEQVKKRTSFSLKGEGYADVRVAHLSKKNHIILGKKIYNAIMNKETNFKVNLTDYENDFSQEEVEKYWICKKNFLHIIETRYQ